MRTIEIRDHASGGLYGDEDFKKAFNRILDSVENFVPLDRSYGNLSLKGNGAMAVAKAKALRRDVENMIDILDALTIGSK